MNRCIPHGLRKTEEHNYEAIFNEEIFAPTITPGDVNGHGTEMLRMLLNKQIELVESSKPRKKTYVYSICTRCGHIIKESK